MIIGFDKTDIHSWKADLQAYEQRKRTLFPDEKESQRQFMPARSHKSQPKPTEGHLQKYMSAELPSKAKQQINDLQRSLKRFKSKKFNYDKSYDIITLHPLGEDSTSSPLEKLKKNNAPIRNLYNVINGEQLKEEYLKDRRIILPKQYLKKDLNRSRDFNIVNLQYREGNTARQKEENAKLEQQALQKCATNHVYDNIYNRYYNPEQEERYWTNKKQENIKIASQNFEVKLPPTYQTRERYIQDYTKPLPEPMKRMDQRKEAYKRSHQQKYLFEERYKIKNVVDADRRESMLLRRFNHDDVSLNKSAIVPGERKIKSFGFD